MGGFGRYCLAAMAVLLVVAIPPSSTFSTENLAPPATAPTPAGSAIARAGAGIAVPTADDVGFAEGYFTENQGQVAAGIRYYARGNPAVALRDDGVLFVLTEVEGRGNRDAGATDEGRVLPEAGRPVTRSAAYLARFEGTRPAVPFGRDLLPFSSNFFIGSDPSRWRTGVPSYGEVVYENLYDGIDLVYRTAASGVEYEFVVRPGSRPDAIAVRFEGIESLQLDGNALTIRTPIGDVRESAPYAYQTARGEVDCRFALRGALSYAIDCEAWDPSEPLVIDPFVYATFLGGTGWDHSKLGFAVDRDGNAYASGLTMSTDFPITPGAFDKTLVNWEGFVAKIAPAGDQLVFATFIGGSAEDAAESLQVDDATGAVYVAGLTRSGDFPTTRGAYDDMFNSANDAFVAKLSPAGDALIYSTYVGGSSHELGLSIAVDAGGAAYVTGFTQSPDFPATPGAFDVSYDAPEDDGYVIKLNRSGASLDYATFLGGNLSEVSRCIAVDSHGSAFVSGYTSSPNFPVTSDAFDTTFNGASDDFVTKLSPDGTSLVYSTFLGGSDGDGGGYKNRCLAVDPVGNAYVASTTHSADFPVSPGAVDRVQEKGDAYVAKLDPAGGALVYATFLGGNSSDAGYGVAVDADGRAFVTGETASMDFPRTCDALSGPRGGQDAFVAILSKTGTGLLYGTYIGGSAFDVGRTIALGPAGAISVAGGTESTDFPVTPGALDTSYGGAIDGFVVRFTLDANACLPDLELYPSSVRFVPMGPLQNGSSVRILASVWNVGQSDAANVSVRFHDGVPSPPTRIGGDQVIPLLASGGTGTASLSWVAAPPGDHVICVQADPDDTIREVEETDNEVCVPVEVLAPRADYAPVNQGPAAQVVAGLSRSVRLSTDVENIGGDATATATLAFFNESTPGAPFVTYPIPPLQSSSSAGPFVAVWLSPALPGTYAVTACVDYADVLVESNESNNAFTWTVRVVAAPITSLVIGAPNYTSGATYVTSTTPIRFSVADPGRTGIRNTTYRVDNGTWTNYTAAGPFTLDAEGTHYLEWSSEDLAGNVEAMNARVVWVDDTPPATELLPAAGPYSPDTVFTLNATDGGSGVARTEYRIDGGPWTTYVGGFTIASGDHLIGCRSIDNLGNTEAERTRAISVAGLPNWKPVVAALFAIILVIAGAWASRRAPWKGGKGRQAALKAFAVFALPFVVLEAATGIVSLFTGLLAIPSELETGAFVDSAILAAGVAVAVYRWAKARPPVP